jgi:uncharacterized protein (TIGR02996 family)
MPDDQGFLQAIRADFDDDAVRLVYADWLEEHGDPRAEFIRVGCALARLPAEDPHRRALWEREGQLIVQYKERWFPGRQRYHSWECRRGFLDEVCTDAAPFLEQVETVFRSHPLRLLYLTVSPGDVAALGACPQLALVESLRIKGKALGSAGVRELVRSPYLGRLSALDLSDNGVGPAGARALAESPALAGVVSLDLAHNRIGREGQQALLSSPYLRALARRGLRGGTRANLDIEGVVVQSHCPGTAH